MKKNDANSVEVMYKMQAKDESYHQPVLVIKLDGIDGEGEIIQYLNKHCGVGNYELLGWVYK